MQSDETQREEQKQQIRREIYDLVRALVPPGETVIHVDINVATRCGNNMDDVLFRRYSPIGADPIISLMMLSVLKKRLNKQLRRRPRRRNGS